MKSHFDIAKDAVDLVTPSINQLFERTNRKELHIIVMDPRLKPWESAFDKAILYEASLGIPAEWTIPFDQLARKKAQQAWRNSGANIINQTIHTSSLKDDDLLFYGSFVYGDVVVACSGVEQWYDMLISGWIAVAIEQLCMSEYQNNKIENPTQTYRK
ncbi:hypothetical protein ACP43V_09825 [Vibrio genomosp. F10 str. 9ZC157]|uniref:Uncharacterized protein n=1 Tax=Vibrio genomosp. F10 str. ZF-129 TaxID=1187848 RepID=A0A1E5BHZ1_9VIBR|nr:hypothetical protein [Vibrio genomosp. F10]OEE36872.1 hypothetical protein A1QO_04910 [Vibrio genomosp. F10 str. ZF-129]OEE95414.1 hypothetical protein A1QM_05050 [Vibrio genomosp. F10 str. 9ZC157]